MSNHFRIYIANQFTNSYHLVFVLSVNNVACTFNHMPGHMKYKVND